jgi:hypothetical protein
MAAVLRTDTQEGGTPWNASRISKLLRDNMILI